MVALVDHSLVVERVVPVEHVVEHAMDVNANVSVNESVNGTYVNLMAAVVELQLLSALSFDQISRTDYYVGLRGVVAHVFLWVAVDLRPVQPSNSNIPHRSVRNCRHLHRPMMAHHRGPVVWTYNLWQYDRHHRTTCTQCYW